MTVSEVQKQQQADLHARLWSIANTLRGTMEAYDFKNYILGLIFYRYLSENVEQRVAKLLKYRKLLESQWPSRALHPTP